MRPANPDQPPRRLSFWRAGDRYFLQTDDPETVERIKRWPFARIFGRGYNCYLYIFSIPATHQLEARKMAGIPKNGDFLCRPVKKGVR